MALDPRQPRSPSPSQTFDPAAAQSHLTAPAAPGRCRALLPSLRRQAQALSSECDDLVLRDGLVGVGVLGAVLGLGVGLLMGTSRK